ncbi:unnamed protein product [Microthlaspi erraticum]|uniref:Uncharacterized protein n=1 Tax=Microthlaspi erraticum TaxID=1685480 RepID=A0A6D2HEB0_9BRAS|nr:unnamed protein product [Microthlaspi erraticum]
MRLSSSPASEIPTTRKSQYQRNRSGGGRIAPAVSQTGNGISFKNSPSLSGKIISKIIRTYPRVTIKDLRLRRVFSPSSISIDWEFKPKGENQSKAQNEESQCESLNSNVVKEGNKIDADKLGNVEVEDFLETTPPESELLSSEPFPAVNEAERICEETNGSAVKKSVTNLSSKSVLHQCSRAKMFKNHGSFSYKRMLPYLMQAADDGTSSGRCSKPEKSFGQSPAVINLPCDKETVETKIACSEDPKEEVAELMTGKFQLPVMQSVDRVFNNNNSAGNLCGNSSPLKRVIASSPNKKPACSKRKLFKTPGSVNYRRMLPYLRDVQEDKPRVPETVNHQKNTEESTPSSMLVCESEGKLETVTSNVARESPDDCFNEDKETVPCESVSLSPEVSDPGKEQETQVKHVIPNTEKNLEVPCNDLGAEAPLSSPLATSSLGEENINGAEKTEATSFPEQLEANSPDLTAEMLDPTVILATPTSISPTKGILKRSIRGCRGICSCLNCSSFRLNAERAFEFSRNQLQDTEVMVLDLVGEISHLRDLLEKHDSESHKSQAGEAAKRASEAAELAQSRLHQMNEDLQVHCRIPNEQRARVKFAHYVHEKTILKAFEPNNLIHTSSP